MQRDFHHGLLGAVASVTDAQWDYRPGADRWSLVPHTMASGVALAVP